MYIIILCYRIRYEQCYFIIHLFTAMCVKRLGVYNYLLIVWFNYDTIQKFYMPYHL